MNVLTILHTSASAVLVLAISRLPIALRKMTQILFIVISLGKLCVFQINYNHSVVVHYDWIFKICSCVVCVVWVRFLLSLFSNLDNIEFVKIISNNFACQKVFQVSLAFLEFVYKLWNNNILSSEKKSYDETIREIVCKLKRAPKKVCIENDAQYDIVAAVEDGL